MQLYTDYLAVVSEEVEKERRATVSPSSIHQQTFDTTPTDNHSTVSGHVTSLTNVSQHDSDYIQCIDCQGI